MTEPPMAQDKPPPVSASVRRARTISVVALDDMAQGELQPAAAGALRDPVCGMSVTSAAQWSESYEGQSYYFCSKGCQDKFHRGPRKYLVAHPLTAAAAPAPPSAGAIYTCPMHAQIEQVGPGGCPLCGMALEPKAVGAQADSAELVDMTHRLALGVALTVPVVIVAMAPFGMPFNAAPALPGFIELALATAVVFWLGAPILARAWTSFYTRHLNMFSLIGLGTCSAYLLSLVSVVAPGILPDAFKDHGAAPLYFESAAVIMTLVLLGQVLELRARSRTGDAVRSLLNLTPDTVRRVAADGSEEEVAVAGIVPGERLRARPGDRLAVDGTVVEGFSSVDESTLTGEPLPVDKHPGDAVRAGTLNQNGTFVYRAEGVGEATLLAQIVRLVNQASRSRAPVQRTADSVAAWFVPVVIAAALLAFACWALFGPEPRLAHGFVALVSVLIIACPCALGLATPLSIVVGVGRGAQSGILFKDALALQQLERVDTLVLDKTGTLTEGRPSVLGVTPAEGVSADELLGTAAALAQHSDHPLSKAITAFALARGTTLVALEQFVAEPGMGVTARQGNESLALGNAGLMQRCKVPQAALTALLAGVKDAAASAVLVARGATLMGAVGLSDAIKPGSRATLDGLRRAGLKLVLASGDRESSTHAVADALGIGEFHGGMLPADKYQLVLRLKNAGARVAFAGDGINDAAALALADVGIAMGTGADIAIDSASVILVKGDLAGISRARQLSRATMANIRQNLGFAFAYNFLGVPLAAGALYPEWGLLLSPMIASAAMSLSSLSVIANALRLRAVRLS